MGGRDGLLRGERPFAVPPIFTRLRVPMAPPPSLRSITALPPEVADVLDRALSFAADQRPTAAEIQRIVRGCSRASSRLADSAGCP